MKHSEILRQATAHLYNPDTNPNGSGYVCIAIAQCFNSDVHYKGLANRWDLEKAVCNTVLEAFGYYTAGGPSVLGNVYEREKGIYTDRYDAHYVVWRDAWVQALITKLEEEGN